MLRPESKPLFWREDPIWKRLHAQRSWGVFLRECSRVGIHIRCKWSYTARKYHAEINSIEVKNDAAYIGFVSEGYGEHVLGAIRLALGRYPHPIAPRVRSTLLEAMLDYLRDEIEGRW